MRKAILTVCHFVLVASKCFSNTYLILLFFLSCCYRQLRRDLDRAREDLLLSTEIQAPHLLKDNFYKVQFYKPVVAAK